jgi:hypothetical protein
MYGTGKQLYRVIVELMTRERRAPKQWFLTVDVEALLGRPDYYFSREQWDEKAEAKSPE